MVIELANFYYIWIPEYIVYYYNIEFVSFRIEDNLMP